MEGLGLGIDAGGTETRWALATPSGEILADGSASGLTGLLIGTAAGRARLAETLAEIASAARAVGSPARVVAGMTGVDPTRTEIAKLLGDALELPESAVSLRTDIEIAYLDVFEPGAGYLVYSGTGSIGFFIDEDGAPHRVGGFGGIVDDAGSGFWIAIQALRWIWRAADEQPSHDSALAKEVFESIGGSDWNASRRFVYEGGFAENRGKVGRLALAVAKAAHAGDGEARAILTSAGVELARLARLFLRRFGPRPIALAGRVVQLHPLIEGAMREALSEAHPETRLSVCETVAHRAAARLAAKSWQQTR